MDYRWIAAQTLALAAGLVTVVAINKAGPVLFRRAGLTFPGQSTTLTNGDLVAFLALSFIAGFAGAFVIGIASRPLHPAPLLVYLAIGLLLDGLALLNTLAGFPAWFRWTFIGSLPLQVGAGAWLGSLLSS